MLSFLKILFKKEKILNSKLSALMKNTPLEYSVSIKNIEISIFKYLEKIK